MHRVACLTLGLLLSIEAGSSTAQDMTAQSSQTASKKAPPARDAQDSTNELELLKRCDNLYIPGKTLNDEEDTRAFLSACSNGIEIAGVKFYDDALLRQQLEADRSRLAALNAFDQSALKVGDLSGASLGTSGVGIAVQGPSLPTVQSVLAAGATTPTVTTTSGGTSPPASNVPSPSLSLPSTISPSALSNLDEELQLQEEIANLSLLLEGSLSDQYFKGKNQEILPRIRSTIGVPITINTPERYKNAVAVVEVSVASRCIDKIASCEGSTSDQQGTRPTVITVLPRERTYNVAALTDKNLTASGGIVTGVMSASAGFLKGKKTYYVVKDQDTIAGTFLTSDPKNWAGIWWFFRPVLGQKLVSSGPRQLLAQVAFPYRADPNRTRSEDLGTVQVASYWRKFNSKTGAVGEEILGSYTDYRASLTTTILDLNIGRSLFSVRHLDDLHDGSVFADVAGSFPGGTYVRLGSKALRDEASGLQLQSDELNFTATVQDLALERPYIVFRDGRSEELTSGSCLTKPEGTLSGTYLDETHIRLSGTLTRQPGTGANSLPPMVFVVGSKVYPTSVLQTVSATSYSATVPANIDPADEIILKPLLVADGRAGSCSLSADAPSLGLPSMNKRLIYLGTAEKVAPERTTLKQKSQRQNGSQATVSKGTASKVASYLSFDPNVPCARALFPPSLQVLNADGSAFDSSQCHNAVPGSNIARLQIAKDDIGPDGATVLLRSPEHGPFVLTLPALPKEAKDADSKPKNSPKEAVVVGTDDAVINLATSDKVTSVKFGQVPLKFSQDSKTLKLTGLVDAKVTASPGSKTLTLRVAEADSTVDLEVVSTRIEVLTK